MGRFRPLASLKIVPAAMLFLLLSMTLSHQLGIDFGTAHADGKPAVTDARLGVDTDMTRVVLNLTGATSYRVFTLADPARVVIDLDEVDWNIPAGRKLQGRGLVAAMRYGLFKVGTSRVVLDLSEPAEVTQVALLAADAKEPLRLLIDLATTSEADFRSTSKVTLFASTGTGEPPIGLNQEGANQKPATPVDEPTAAQNSEALAATQPETAQSGASQPSPAQLLALLPIPKPGTPAPKPEKPIIVIDPGHGGIDPGAVGEETQEKAITLAVAKALKKVLEDTGEFEVLLTRESDVFVALRDRFKVARDNAADLFISLHADSHANPKTRGASVYTLSEKASDAEAAALAAKENKSDVIAGVDLSNENEVVTGILIDLAQRETTNLSARFAKLLVKSLKGDTLMLGKSHRFAGFAVLKAPDVPSVLLEMGYISSQKDQQLLTDKSHQKRLAKAIARAVQSYFDWQAQMKRT